MTLAIAMQKPETLLGEREEDVVLRGKISVDGGWAVLDALGNLADRDVLVTLLNKQVAGGVQNGAANRLAFSAVSFFDAHCFCLRGGWNLNGVQS